MKFVKWLSIIFFIGILALFVVQNIERTPTIDINGAYLSLDLYIWGLEQREPISLLWYLFGSFLLGVLFMKMMTMLAEK